MLDFGYWIPFNEKYKVGINVNTSNSREIAKKIQKLELGFVGKISKGSIQKVAEYFTWESQEEKLFEIYEGLINAK